MATGEYEQWDGESRLILVQYETAQPSQPMRVILSQHPKIGEGSLLNVTHFSALETIPAELIWDDTWGLYQIQSGHQTFLAESDVFHPASKRVSQALSNLVFYVMEEWKEEWPLTTKPPLRSS